MDISNLAIVRVNNTIPYDGVVRPISNSHYLTKDCGSMFAYEMNSLLRRKNMLVSEDTPDSNKINSSVQKDYLPYTSSYNSMSLWCINGLVPDESTSAGAVSGNDFSHKNVVIIDSLEAHMNENLMSMNPTDTAILGDAKLSPKARVLIRQEYYDSLSPEEKTKLHDMNFILFHGDMKTAVDRNLTEMGYQPETLSLERADKGYKPSATSDELRDTILQVAKDNDKSMEFHYNIITMITAEKERFDRVKNDFKYMTYVRDLYERSFMEYLFKNTNIDKAIEYECINYSSVPAYMEQLCDEISRIGIDEYKSCLDQYNHAIESLRSKGSLPTPQELINAKRNKEPINLGAIIESEAENTNEAQ